MSVICYFPIPKSTRKSDRLLLQTGYVPYDKKPDTDNLVKAIADALNGVAYLDDKQICSLKVKKFYGVRGLVKIRIKEIEVNT